MQKKADQEIVVKVETKKEDLEFEFEEDFEGERYLKLAATLVLVLSLIHI